MLVVKQLLNKNKDKEGNVVVCRLNQDKLRSWSRLMRLICPPPRLFPAFPVINATPTVARCDAQQAVLFYPNCNASLIYNQGGSVVRNLLAKAEDPSSTPGLGRSPGGIAWKPWQAAVHGVSWGLKESDATE